MFAFKTAALGLALVSLTGAFPNIAPRASSRSECPATPTAVMTVTAVPKRCTSSDYIFSSTPAPVTSSAAASASPEAPVQSSAPAQSAASTPETPIVSAASTGAVESSAAPSKPASTIVNTSVGPTQSQVQPSIPVTTTNSGSMMQFNAAMAGVIAAGALAALV